MTTLLNDPLIVRGLVTVALLLLVAALRLLLFRLIRRGADVLQEDQRRQLFYTRSALSALLVIGLLVIWLGQLQNLLLSLTAVTVAIVIATKELLMCISGFVLRTGASVFSIGDRVEVDGIRGEVTDHSVLSTTLLELAPASQGDGYSGRTVVLPNSVFLQHPVRNENFSPSFALHSFDITLETRVNVAMALHWLQTKSDQLCEPFLEAAKRSNAMAEKKLGVDIQGPEASISLGTSDLGRTVFRISLFCPKKEVFALEKLITAGFLDAIGSDVIPLSTAQVAK
ncbi:mechanosensitive ion channel domain-containing protein [Denitrobaculum tricleocarpae]|uniref:Mechanosensitive ion channel family protein n=1 Tax=Denitrobaculum tricleocarpae TaxID=2591009 RepID=A0A545U2Q8_9PROT|nr:mechanosensitive ion channel domain-containing protein [Denitrobaculum tricleocarpae]TQV83765.1 mechanosensitive ion channel family protein [Denitrobaculum tricleocarpae]